MPGQAERATDYESYVYDAENRLVSATGAKAATLSYDPLGRLWQTSASSGTSQFLYDVASGSDKLAAEYDASGTLLRRYLHGPNADQPLVWYEGATMANPRWLHSDERGSPIAVVDSGNNPIIRNSYDEWGAPATTNAGRFQYTGQAWIPELGLYYYKARMYSPALGRFMQTDPIGYKDQVNLYAYVGNDPVNSGDPSGLCTGSLLENKDGSCLGAGSVNPGLAGAGTSEGAVPHGPELTQNKAAGSGVPGDSTSGFSAGGLASEEIGQGGITAASFSMNSDRYGNYYGDYYGFNGRNIDTDGRGGVYGAYQDFDTIRFRLQGATPVLVDTGTNFRNYFKTPSTFLTSRLPAGGNLNLRVYGPVTILDARITVTKARIDVPLGSIIGQEYSFTIHYSGSGVAPF